MFPEMHKRVFLGFFYKILQNNGLTVTNHFHRPSSHSCVFPVPRVHGAVSPRGVRRLLAGRSAQLSGGCPDGSGVSHLLLHL